MAIEGQIQALLEPLVAGGCYPVINPNEGNDIVYPYITYQVIARIPLVTLDGPEGTEKVRIQIDCFAEIYAEAKGLEAQIKTAMAGASFVNYPIQTGQDLYEKVAKKWRQLMEFYVWSQ